METDDVVHDSTVISPKRLWEQEMQEQVDRDYDERRTKCDGCGKVIIAAERFNHFLTCRTFAFNDVAVLREDTDTGGSLFSPD